MILRSARLKPLRDVLGGQPLLCGRSNMHTRSAPTVVLCRYPSRPEVARSLSNMTVPLRTRPPWGMTSSLGICLFGVRLVCSSGFCPQTTTCSRSWLRFFAESGFEAIINLIVILVANDRLVWWASSSGWKLGLSSVPGLLSLPTFSIVGVHSSLLRPQSKHVRL